MTPHQALEDAELKAEAGTHGARLEPKATKAQGTQEGCYFTGAGEADREKMLGAAC